MSTTATHDPKFGYWSFDRDQVDHLPALERAEEHANHAEHLLANTRQGTYVMTPLSISAAHVHAQLATAWATMAAAWRSNADR